MQLLTLSPGTGLFALNVMVASVALGFAAVVAVLLVRRSALSLRHGLLCVAMVLTLACPLPTWIASNQGFGIVPISVGLTDRETLLDPESTAPAAETGGGSGLPDDSRESVESSLPDEVATSSEPRQQTPECVSTVAPAGLASAKSQPSPDRSGKYPAMTRIGQIGILLALVWAAVALWLVLRQVRGWFVIRRLRRSLRPATDPRLVEAASQALAAVGGKQCVPVYESPLAPAPLTLGWWPSVIVMPEGLAESLDNEQLACVLAHEAAHVARHDTTIALLQLLVGVGFWWNPLLHAVNKNIGRLREGICDDHVANHFGSGLPLAEAIVKVAEWSVARHTGTALAVTLLDDADDIEQRVTRLAQQDRTLSVGLNAWSAALIGLFAVVLTAVSFVPAVQTQAVASPAPEAISQKAGGQVRKELVTEVGDEPCRYGDDILKQWLSKSDLVVVGKIVYLPTGQLVDEIGVPHYFATVEVLDVCKGDANLKGKTIKVEIVRSEIDDKDRHPLIKKDAQSVLFLKGSGKQWITADVGFGVQHPTPALVKSLKRMAKQEKGIDDKTLKQSPPSKTTTTWQDLGFNRLPDGFSTDEIPLFEGLNEARDTWSFEGEITDGEVATPLKGSLHIIGNPKSGMLPVWKMAWGWPADDPGHMIIYNIMAGPRKDGFDLMLIRIGPVKNPGADKAKPKVQPTPFQGTWNLENRTITWTEQDLPAGLPGQPAEKDASKPKQTFEMVVAADGKILIRNSKHAPPGQMTSGKAIVRTGKAPAEPVILTGEHRFKTAAEVLDRRIKPWLPPQATEISLLSERNGHYARYKVEEDHFMKFLDGLWEADKGSSAHKRDEMGEGKPGNPKGIAKRLKTVGQEPLGDFRVYHSPSKRSAAMTTYYYDREAGIAYHDRGYW